MNSHFSIRLKRSSNSIRDDGSLSISGGFDRSNLKGSGVFCELPGFRLAPTTTQAWPEWNDGEDIQGREKRGRELFLREFRVGLDDCCRATLRLTYVWQRRT